MKLFKPEIKHTTDYDSFQHYRSNRAVNRRHLQTLIDDPTFPDKFPTSPIVVNSNLYIIDGQHRFYAAKKLGVPIYYIIDPKATEDDINIRNTQTRRWERKAYIHFFADKKRSYKIIEDLMSEHKVSANFVIASIRGLMPEWKQHEISLKKGDLNCESIEEDLKSLVGILSEALRECRSVKGDKAKLLSTDPYIIAFAEIYRENKTKFEKILEKISICSLPLVYATCSSDAKQMLCAVAKWRPHVKSNI